MNTNQTHILCHAELSKLRKLYLNKCQQAEKAKICSSTFMYQVLKAEADTIRTEIDKF